MSGSVLTPSDVESFKRDGELPVRGAFELEWVELLRQGVEADLIDPSPRFEVRLDKNSGARYCEDYWASSSPDSGLLINRLAVWPAEKDLDMIALTGHAFNKTTLRTNSSLSNEEAHKNSAYPAGSR